MARFFVNDLVLLVLYLVSSEYACCNGHTQCSESDRKALLDFKNGLNDPENRLSSWRGSNCCQWRGVLCDNSSGAVIAIDLHNPHPYRYYSPSRYGFWNLSGELDPALLRLKSLRHLDLSLNTFGHISIPEFIGSLKGLQYLNLSKAEFSGTIPSNLGNLFSLQYLDISYNDISGAIPPNLGNLSSLQYLDVSYNDHGLAADGLQWFAGLGSLRHLAMDQVDLKIVGPNWLRVLNMHPLLTELHFSGCGLSGLIPSLPFVNFTSLAVIDLSFNSFNSTFPDWIVNVSGLVSLDMSENSLHGKIPLAISELPNLRLLLLEDNDGLTTDCSELLKGSWRRIEVLHLYGNRVHGKLPASIGNMTSLIDFDLSGNNIEGGIPSSIGNLYNLTYFDLSVNNLYVGLPEFLEGTENCFIGRPLPNLKTLRLSNNRLIGNLSEWLGQLKNLDTLSLENNLFQGPIPTSFGQLSKLVYLDVSSNHLTGTVSESHFSKLINLKELYMSDNSLILNVSSKWIPPFQVQLLYMGSCHLGPSFPTWLETQKQVMHLDFSNASIFAPIPKWLWDRSSDLQLLNGSFNRLQGQLPNQLKFSSDANIDFRSNHLQGPIPLLLNDFISLNLANNNFSGPIPVNIGDALSGLVFLSLSGNHLTGKIPASIGNMSLLEVLDLSRNNLTGSIPASLGKCSNLHALDLQQNNLSGAIPWKLGQLKHLQTLHLNDNRISGKLPSSLHKCSKLETLDLGNNKFTGNIPPWIGKKLTALRILRLRSNALSGRLPSQLSRLSSLQILDVADNNLVGTIPARLGDLEAMARVQNVNRYLLYGKSKYLFYEESLVVSSKNQILTYTKILSLVTCIDLSKNNLNGEFPEAIMNLSGLIVLNIAGNNISGHIPKRIAALRELESLDVSNNQLSGTIPSYMSSMASLTYLNFSNNNLSGMVPFSGQMATFDETSYLGNPGLCGPPLLKKCQSEDSDRRGFVEEDSGNETMDELFFLNLGLGFAVGLLIPYIILAIRRSWGDVYFNFVDSVINKTLPMARNRATSHRNQRRRRALSLAG